jgi:hypothetical protein
LQTKSAPAGSPVKKMRLRYAGSCSSCGTMQPAGEPAMYHRVLKNIMCLACADGASAAVSPTARVPEPASLPITAVGQAEMPSEPVAVTTGTAGASALREFERRKQKRETRIRTEHPRLGKLILAISDEPTSTRVWQTGAVGEQQLGRALGALVGAGVLVLHDRRIPGSRANIDHLAVGPAGVFVVDAKRYRGKRPERRVEGGLLRPRMEKLFVGGRDRSALLDGIGKQVDLVRAALRKSGVVDVLPHGVLCFLDADWPMMGGSFRVRGFDVLSPRSMQKMIGSAGGLGPTEVTNLHRLLGVSFPSA